MGEGGLEVLVLDVDDRIERLALQIVLKQIEEAVLGIVTAIVVVEYQPTVEVAIVPHASLDIFTDEVIVAEEFSVGDKLHQRARALGAFRQRMLHDAAVGSQLPFGEFGDAGFTLSERLHTEPTGQGVHCLGTHTVQAHRLLEHLAVVLGTSVEAADSLNHHAQRDAAAIVADTHFALGKVDGHIDAATEARRKFINGVVYHLFDEDIDAVVMRRAVAKFADIHARTQPDVFHILKMDNALIIIFGGSIDG